MKRGANSSTSTSTSLQKKFQISLPWKVGEGGGSRSVKVGGAGGRHGLTTGAAALPSYDAMWQVECYEKMVNSFIHSVYQKPTPDQMRAIFTWACDWARVNCLEWKASKEEKALVYKLLEQKVGGGSWPVMGEWRAGGGYGC